MDINGDMIMYNKKNPLRCFFAFEGYNSQGMALDKLKERYTDFDWVCVGRSEIDKYAILAANAVYPQYADRNYGDISKIDWNKVPDFDLFTYSFPCQDISRAGLQRGLDEKGGTRSSLLWECRKTIEIKKPKYLLMENVKALTSGKFMPYLKKWLFFLEDMGYSNFTKVLNAKDYGVPQNRERVFVVSIYGKNSFTFPSHISLNKSLDFVLDDNVEESFYIKEDKIHLDELSKERLFVKYTRDKKGAVVGRRLSNISNTIHTSTGNGGNTDCFVFEPKIKQLCNILKEGNYSNPTRGRVYGVNGICPTLDTMGGGGREPKILTKDYRIRKLTPRECFRLMGVSEENIDKIQNAGISKTQQYKMAGNSIVVDVLYYIFKKMFIDKKANKGEQQILFG